MRFLYLESYWNNQGKVPWVMSDDVSEFRTKYFDYDDLHIPFGPFSEGAPFKYFDRK